MRNKVRKSLAFLLALALVVSVMSGLGLSVSAEQESNTPGTEEVQQQDKTEAGAAPSEVKAEEEAAKPEEKPVLEEKEDEQKKQEETKTDDAAKDNANAQDGDQKDEPQAEPAAEEPAEPEGKPSASYLSTLSVEELYAYLTKLDDNNFAAAWKELTDSQKEEYNAYVLKMTFGDNKTTTSYEGGGAAASMTNVAGLVSNLAASQKALRNSPARAARAAVQAAKDVELSNQAVNPVSGLYMNKWITKNEKNTADTDYTIHLESYTTGKTTTTYSSKPCDIVLVLDQSGSMAERFKKVTYTEKKFMDTATNRQAFEYRDNLYVKATVGDVVGKHIPVRVEQEFDIGSLSYTYTYTLEGKEHTVTIVGRNNKIPSSTNQDQFFADGVEKQLYYAEESTNDKYTRLDGLKDAVNQFVSSVESDATTSNVDHNIAIVGFGSYPKTDDVRQNTEILTGVNISTDREGYKNGVAYNGDGYSTATGNALQSAKTQGGKKSIADAIDALDASGATRTDCGIEMANDIFKAKVASDPSRYEGGKRNKVVVVFTDGEPNNYNGFDSNYATKAIQAAKTLKGDNATVYTIGIFSNADASPITSSTTKMNRFMHYVSSCYPQADSMSYEGTSDKLGYYLTAADSAALNEIFSKIASEIGSSDVALNATTQTIDKMSAEFKLPDNIDGSKVKVYEVPCTGVSADGSYTFGAKTELKDAEVSINKGAGTVSVSGFDYSKKYINKDSTANIKGYKLLIEFPVEYKNDARFGGNNIASNDIGSGIYNNNQCYGTYDVPQVNRAIDYEIAAKDQTIYVTNQADLQGLLDYFKTKEGKEYKPNGTNNKYVDITYTLKQGNTEIGTYTIKAAKPAEEGTWTPATDQTWTPALEDCTVYTWTCTVKPTTEGKGALGVDGTPDKPAEKTDCGSATGTVHVLYPTVSARDEFIYWGETIVPNSLITVADNWTDLNGNHTTGTPMETKPQIEVNAKFETGEEGNTPSKDSDYNVIAKIGDRDITSLLREHKRIVSNKQAHGSCDDTSVGAGLTEKDFRIHVKVKKLTVEKIVGGNMGDTNQGFTFTGRTIYDDSKNEVKNKFTLKNGQDVTFKLKVGDDVSITEDSVAGYETSYKVGDDSEVKHNTYNYGKVEANNPDAVTVIYTNEKQINPPNGIITTIAPYAIMVVLAAGAGVYFVYSRRRRNR